MAPDDFFDEEWEEPSRTQETAVTRPQEGAGRGARRAPRMPRPPRRPRTGAGGPQPQWGRLAALAAAIIVLLLIIVFAAKSCSGTSATDANKKYFQQDVAKVVRTSAGSSAQLHSLLRSRPLPLRRVQARLRNALAAAQKAESEAGSLKPPKQVALYQPFLEIAMAYRVNGLRCLEQATPTAWAARTTLKAGQALVPCMQRLSASDVVYSDSFAGPSTRALSKAGIDAQVPTSSFLRPSGAALLTPRGIGAALRDLHASVVRKGLHGLALDSVKVEPGGATLKPGTTLNQVKASDNLAFVVSVTNGGDFPEVGIPVKVTLTHGSDTLKGSATISRIARGQTLSVSVHGIVSGQTPPNFGVPYKMRVLVTPVPGERTAANNSATYTIAFTL